MSRDASARGVADELLDGEVGGPCRRSLTRLATRASAAIAIAAIVVVA
jgi:hypothetical protein